MDWEFRSDIPIYVQLIQKLKLGIMQGIYKKGEKMPSVRDLAFQSKVNPNTMQKALLELEASGLVRVERTVGRFVTDDENKIASCRSALAEESAKNYIERMHIFGFTKEEAITFLERGKIE